MTYRQALLHATQLLQENGVPDSSNDAWLLLHYVSGMSRTDYILNMTRPMPEEQKDAYEQATARRASRIPLQHITGEQEFMGLPFYVSEDVLCPRQDTETLVEEACRMIPGQGSYRILDMCTGSGCIIISLLSRFPDAEGTGVDLSEKALEMAARNAARNHVKLSLVHSDLFDKVQGRYDMIVSNPPYIPSGQISGLMPEVAEHEPLMALDGKEDGLYFYRKLAAESKAYLSERGKLLFEIGYDQGKDVSEMLIYEGFQNVRVIRDLAHNDRVVIGEL